MCVGYANGLRTAKEGNRAKLRSPLGSSVIPCSRRLLDCAPAWDGNWTSDCFIAWSWEGGDGQRRLIAVNYAGNQSQCYVRLPFPDLTGRAVRLKDLMGPASYDRDGTDLGSRGLYLDLPPWSYHVFEMSTLP